MKCLIIENLKPESLEPGKDNKLVLRLKIKLQISGSDTTARGS